MVEMITYDPEVYNETWNKISNVTEKRMKQYKLNTHLISGYRKDEEIPKEVKDDLISEGCPESWFSPVEEELEVGDWVVIENSLSDRYPHNSVGRINELLNYSDCRVMVYGKTDDNLANTQPLRTLRKATEKEVSNALIAEAKRRGLWDDTPIKKHVDNGMGEIFGNYKPTYQPVKDKLWSKQGVIYSKGEWAEPVIDEPIQINGVKIKSIKSDWIELECGEFISTLKFNGLANLTECYNLSIYRKGENITSQIKQIAEKL